MRIARTLPPAAAPIPWKTIARACLPDLFNTRRSITVFENELKTYFNIEYCYLLSSGKTALTIILQALHELFPERDEVLIPAFTCFSVPAAIKKAGLKIKLCDLNVDSLDFDRKKLHQIADTERNRNKLLCIIPTHLFGIPADVHYCRQIFSSSVIIVEDTAQAMATEWQGKKLGTLGDIGFFSLGRGKPLSTIEGGIIITNREDIGKVLKKRILPIPKYTSAERTKLLAKALLATLFQYPTLFWLPKGLPFLQLGETIYETDLRMKTLSTCHSKLAKDWQSRVKIFQQHRRNNAQYFLNLTKNKFESVSFPWFNEEQALIRLPGLVNNTARNEIINSAFGRKYGIMPSYPVPINEIPQLQNDFCGERYPTAKMLSDQLITIPTHQYMTEDDYRKISGFLFEHK